MKGIIGLIGAGIFFLSWIVEAIETKRAGKITFSKKFFVIRIIASIILIIEAIRISSLAFLLVNIGNAGIMAYNLYKIEWKHRWISQ